MKRRIFKLALFLLLGAMLNVAVAWGCALLLNPFDWSEGPFGVLASVDPIGYWSCQSCRMSGADVRCYAAAVGILEFDNELRQRAPRLQDCRAPWEANEGLDDSTHSMFDARGWPCASLWS